MTPCAARCDCPRAGGDRRVRARPDRAARHRRARAWCSRIRSTPSSTSRSGRGIVVTFSDPVAAELRSVRSRSRGPPVRSPRRPRSSTTAAACSSPTPRSRPARPTASSSRRRRADGDEPADDRPAVHASPRDRRSRAPRPRRWSRSTARPAATPTAFRPMFETLDDPPRVLRAARSADGHARRRLDRAARLGDADAGPGDAGRDRHPRLDRSEGRI